METNQFYLFKAASADCQIFSPVEWVATLQTCQTELQTAILQVGPANDAGPEFVLILVRGQIVNLYQVSNQVHRLPVSDLHDLLPGDFSSLMVRTLALTPHTMRLVKIMLEQSSEHSPERIESANLEQVVAKSGRNPEPGLLHVAWPGAEGLVLLPGGDKPSRHTLFIASEQILHSAGGMTALFGWKEPECDVKVYSSKYSSQAWDEYLLHHVFTGQVAYLLQRFEELTGRLLVNTIVREMNFAAAAHDWGIMVSARNVTDQVVFSSPQQAGQVYQRLFEIVIEQATHMLGADLLDMLLRESLERLSPTYRSVFKKFILLEQLEKSGAS